MRTARSRPRTAGTATALVGVLLIAGALLLRLAIVPTLLVLPGDVDETRTYEGTVHRLLDPQALAAGDIEHLFITDAAVELTRHVAVITTEGDDALVVEDASAVLADGTPVASQEVTYSVDRRTMRHSDGFAGDDRVQAREGLVIGWPIGTQPEDHEGWSDDLQTTVTATYAGEAEVDGVTTYRFTTEVAPTPIQDPELLALLPAALPKSVLQQLALAAPQDLPLPMGEMIGIAAELPDPVPLTYLYSSSTTYWVEPVSGVVVDVERRETREAALTPASLPEPLALTAVFDWTYAQTDASVADALADATDAAARIALASATAPLALAGLGLVLLVTGLLVRRGSHRAGSADADPEEGTSTIDLDDAAPVGAR
jgi:hypothetical protein